MKKKLYIICNSHLDPIWLWNRSSGRSSWLNTMHSVIRIMDENPDLKFTCSSTALYRFIEEIDLALFKRIAALVKKKRWEIVGGWEVQSDVILSRPQTIIHQALSGKKYIYDRFGIDVKIGYCVDSFGHSAGLPKILKASGFTHYVYMRGGNEPGIFNWQADDGSSVTALHILNSYGTGARMDFLKTAFFQHLNSQLEYQAMFFGMGDHGGGISRKELAFIREMQKEYDIVFSTLGEYFEAVKDLPLETFSGELGPFFRGCYSNCHEVKRKIARAAGKLLTAERLGVKADELSESWQELCFHHFHDILPGTSIRDAFEKDIFPGIGSVENRAVSLIDRQLFRRTAQLDTIYMKEGGIYCWNPHPFANKNIVCLEGFGDPNRNGANFNALRDDTGNELPLQILPATTSYGPCGVVWGRLTAIVDLPPMGEKHFACVVSDRKFPNVGFQRTGKLLKKLSPEVFFDDSRTWGFGLTRFDARLGRMELIGVSEYADGPVCSILRAVYRYGNSELRMDLYDYAGISEIGVKIRLDWQDANCCLKLAWDHALSRPEFFTGSSAAAVCRMGKDAYDWEACEWLDGKIVEKLPDCDEFSMIDWCAVKSGEKIAAFFAPDLHSCDHSGNRMRLTLNRPVYYADHAPFATCDESGRMDMGVSERRFWIAEYDNIPLAELPHYAEARLLNGENREITAHEASGEKVDRFFQLEIPGKQISVLEMRLNEEGKNEIYLYNNGAEITIDQEQTGKITIPAHALKKIVW